MIKKIKIILLVFAMMMSSVILPACGKDNGVEYNDADYARLKAVTQHVENVLYYGHNYNTNTELLPDGIDVLTGEPAFWTYPNGTSIPFSDMANQQNFLRTLVALTEVTGEEKYKTEAEDMIGYFMDNYQDVNGLFYWGGHRIVNLDTLEEVSTETPSSHHELKNLMPYYELMWDVDAEATEKFIKQLWKAHYVFPTQDSEGNVSGSDLNRHGEYAATYDEYIFNKTLKYFPAGEIPDIIQMDEDGNPIIPQDSPGKLPFVNSATDLSYAAFTLYNNTGKPESKIWGEYLMKQYNLASNPDTGMTVYQYKSTVVDESKASLCESPIYTNSGCGDRVKRQFRDFGKIALEANVQWKNTQAMYVDNILMLLRAADEFGIDYYVDWARDYLESFLEYTYIRVNGENKIIPMFNDGTVVYGYKFPEGGYFGSKDTVLGYTEMPSTYLLPILRTLVQLDETYGKEEIESIKTLWNYLREMMDTFNLGDIGAYGADNANLEYNTPINDPFALMTVIELYDYTKNADYLKMARTIGNNIVEEKFEKTKTGFFVDAANKLYSRLDLPDTLALLILDGVIKGKSVDELPYYLADSAYIHGYVLDENGFTEDRNYSTSTVFERTIYDSPAYEDWLQQQGAEQTSAEDNSTKNVATASASETTVYALLKNAEQLSGMTTYTDSVGGLIQPQAGETTRNLNLPTEYQGVTITYSSRKPEIISNNGVVTFPTTKWIQSRNQKGEEDTEGDYKAYNVNHPVVVDVTMTYQGQVRYAKLLFVVGPIGAENADLPEYLGIWE